MLESNRIYANSNSQFPHLQTNTQIQTAKRTRQRMAYEQKRLISPTPTKPPTIEADQLSSFGVIWTWLTQNPKFPARNALFHSFFRLTYLYHTWIAFRESRFDCYFAQLNLDWALHTSRYCIYTWKHEFIWRVK